MSALQHPLPGARVTQRFGENAAAYASYGLRGHEGLDYSAPVGTPVRAAHDGDVLRGQDEGGYGTYVVVSAPNVRTLYGHLSAITATGRVTAGQVIGLSGNTGNSTAPHLHFGVRPVPIAWQNGFKGYVDPEGYFVQEGSDMVMSRKIGLHVIGSRRVALGKPTVLKWIDPSPGDLSAAQAETGPECLFVVRFYQSAEPLDNPEQRADEWVARYRARMESLRQAVRNVVFEGYNEVGDSRIPQHARFETRRLHRMHELGLRVGVGSWGVGHPHESRWGEYDGMIAAMHQADVLCFHEYWADHADVDNNWHVTRFRYHGIWEHVKGHLIAITEAGRDTLYDVVPQGDAGWQKTCGPDEYLADLRRAGELYDAIPEVIGCTIFQSGAIDPTWKDYEVSSIWPRVVAEYNTGGMPPVDPPAPEPEPLLPSTDPFTLAAIESGDLSTMQDKVRWWSEQTVRELEAGNAARGLAILKDMTNVNGGLLYEAENAAEN